MHNSLIRFFFLQHLSDALGPLSKEKDRLLADHNELKNRLSQEYEERLERKRSYQQEAEDLFKMNSKIKE